MPEGPMPQGAEAPKAPSIADAIVETDKNLAEIAGVVTQNPQVPDELKQAVQTAMEAFRAFASGIGDVAAGAAGGAKGPAAVSPEQGGNAGAVPVSMGRPR